MQKVLTAWEEHCAHSDLPRVLNPQLRQAGLSIKSQAVILQFNTTLNPDAYSFHIIGIMKNFVQGRNGVTQKEAEEWANELYTLSENEAYFFCLNQFLFLLTK